MSQAILILGAGGFIGRHLAETIARSGRPVIAATREHAAFVHPDIRNVVAPFDEPGHFAPLLKGCEGVLHAASISTPGSSAAKPQLEGNLRTTLALLEALQDFPDRRVVYLSSGGTLYGDRLEAASELTPLRPRSYHGAGKAASEHFFHAWSAQYDGTAVLLRPSNVYGPGQRPRHGFAVIPTAFDCALRQAPMTIWGNGANVRDYLYIDDFANLCRQALERDLPAGTHVFNASSSLGTSLDDLLDAVDRTTGMPLDRRLQPTRIVDVERITLDNSAARAAFGWSPEVSLPAGLGLTWQWFVDQGHACSSQ
jgi:UDP-glucose 4-epimerase